MPTMKFGLARSECRFCKISVIRYFPLMSKIAEVIERLIKERDELRCEVCDWVGNHFKEPPQDVAKRNGWDCFDTGVWDCYKEKSK